MICPIDKTNLNHYDVNSKKIYYCKTCLGLCIEKETLSYLTGLFLEGEFPDKLKAWSKVEAQEMQVKKWEEDILSCPNHTSHKMNKHYYSGNSKILIDVCGVCQAAWIDGHEIKKLHEYCTLDPLEKVTLDFEKYKIREDIKIKKQQEAVNEFVTNFVTYARNPKILLLYLLKTLIETILKEYGYKKNKITPSHL